MAYKLLYLSSASFWKASCIKTYQHHDALMNAINKKFPLEIIIGIPMRGNDYLKKLVETGNQSRVMSSWRKLPYKISGKLYDGDFDGLLINSTEWFDAVTDVDGLELSSKDLTRYVLLKCKYCMSNDKPIILYDSDNLINERIRSADGSNCMTLLVYKMCKDYHKFTVSSPFEFGIGVDCRENFTPFTIDPEDNVSSTINPLSSRTFITKYVGSNYFRDNFVPYFDECSKYGQVVVAGPKWDKYSNDEKYSKITWIHKFPLTSEKAQSYYSDAVIGLYGTTNIPSFTKCGHYTLRIRESLSS